LALKQLLDIDILLMLFGFFYSLLFIGEGAINKKMREYIQKIKVFFRIAPHLKDKPFYAKAF
jgi:hypothetical protein